MVEVTARHRELADEVLEHAKYHYSDGGWDVVVECMGPEEIAREIAEYVEREGISAPTATDAVGAFEERVGVWADQQAGAIVDGYGSQEAYESAMRGEW